MIKKEKNNLRDATALKIMGYQMVANLLVFIATLNSKRLLILQNEEISFVDANTQLLIPLILFLVINLIAVIIYQYKIDKLEQN